VQSAGFGVWGLGCGEWGVGSRVGCGEWGVGCGVCGVGCGVRGMGCGVYGTGFGLQEGPGFSECPGVCERVDFLALDFGVFGVLVEGLGSAVLDWSSASEQCLPHPSEEGTT